MIATVESLCVGLRGAVVRVGDGRSRNRYVVELPGDVPLPQAGDRAEIAVGDDGASARLVRMLGPEPPRPPSPPPVKFDDEAHTRIMAALVDHAIRGSRRR